MLAVPRPAKTSTPRLANAAGKAVADALNGDFERLDSFFESAHKGRSATRRR
jgi:hypothetical protein